MDRRVLSIDFGKVLCEGTNVVSPNGGATIFVMYKVSGRVSPISCEEIYDDKGIRVRGAVPNVFLVYNDFISA